MTFKKMISLNKNTSKLSDISNIEHIMYLYIIFRNVKTWTKNIEVYYYHIIPSRKHKYLNNSN